MKTNNDPRWRYVDQLSDILALVSSVEICRRFIETQAANADPHNVVLNLKQILKEVKQMAVEIEKMKQIFAGTQEELVKAIYSDQKGGILVQPWPFEGSADNNAAYLITEGLAGRRFRRVQLPQDYTAQ